MTNIVQEAAVMLGMIQQEKRQLRSELVALGVSGPDDQVTTEPQMQAVSRGVALRGLENDLTNFIQNWVSGGGS